MASEAGWEFDRERIRRGNFLYTREFFQTGAPHVPIYVANGAIGGCFDEFGLQSRPQYHVDHGRTHLGWVNHYARDARNGGHNMASLCAVQGRHADGCRPGLAGLTAYRQEFDLASAVLHTQWQGPRGTFHVVACASFANQGIFVWELDQEPASDNDHLSFAWDFQTGPMDAHGQFPERNPGLGERSVEAGLLRPDLWRIASSTNCRRNEVLCRISGGEAEYSEGRLAVHPTGGRCRVIIFVWEWMHAVLENAVEWLLRQDHDNDHRTAARAFWTTGAIVDIPDAIAAKVWLRGKYFLRASLPSFPTHVPEPTGLNANIWGHGFPQDVYYVVENLPRLGLGDISRAQFPIWLDMLPGVLRYTRRLTGLGGAFYPWTPPFENIDGFELEGPTNPDSYEFHNSAYVAAMVWHAWLVNGDESFIESHRAILTEIARFYSELCVHGPDGRVRIEHPRIRSQDEHMAAGEYAQSPLCAMISARAALGCYLAACGVLGVDDPALHERCKDILKHDFDFAALLRPDGTLKTTINDARPPGMQKHPVQLNPIALLPQPDLLEKHPAFVRAWQERMRLTADAEEPRSHGWTFAIFALASARMGSGPDLQADLDLVQPARFADGQWFQFYESSCRLGWQHKKPYYFPASGLYLQALTDAVVQDWRGHIEFFRALPPSWLDGKLTFRGVCLRGGLVAAGRHGPDSFDITVCATRAFRGVLGAGTGCAPLRVTRPDGTTTIQSGGGFEVELSAGQMLQISGPRWR